MNLPKTKYLSIIMTILFLGFVLFLSSCENNQETTTVENKTIANNEMSQLESEKLFKVTMKKHLDAVSNKDLTVLKSTMSPEGKMQLILPSSEIIKGVDGFMDYHREWFESPNWTFETKILNTEIGDKVGIAITEIIYREPERNGKPYFNRMIVSYALEKINDKWYIIKDHASSIEKAKS